MNIVEPEQKEKTIWTIGHSTHSLDEFIQMLQSSQIELVADVRRFPGSRKYPHFNQEALQGSLRENAIEYRHFEALGGRRKARPNSKNTVWRNASFQGYADYMETPAFKDAISELETVASKRRTAYLCSEAVWWRCHRSMISDLLKYQGWEVNHIMGVGKETEHPYTGPANIKGKRLTYEAG
ncbi:DUF488 domain-containing protein [Pricia sp. S334]|uniref:DUF488 domain-containing protein n=1 Tax=Pricia mediterranea TaxID=3076079 RepID=A0ABU3L7M9_9FLAO|nr:DUF488 domain-containing protein [Pricia sp. S334]MDT7829472.1 DUF488 domain-containing protein [Pricia sp. S334]